MPDQSNTKPEPWLDRFAEDASGHSVSSAGTVPEEVQTPGVAAVAAGFGDWQAQCDALIADTRKHVALPSDACVILSLASQVLLARRALRRLDEICALLDDYERQHLTPRNLAFEGMLLPRIAQIARGRTSSPNRPGAEAPTDK